MPANSPTAILLPIGNEILNGRIQDSNTSYAASRLYRRGIAVRRVVALPDELDLLADEIRRHAGMADILITSGGIGATADDMTRQAVALAFDRPLVRNPQAVEQMGEPSIGYTSDVRLRMADLPDGCRLIPNPITKAPGFIVENTYVLPGVPELFRVMFDSIMPELPGSPIAFGELYTHRHEGEFAPFMDEALKLFPSVNIGSYPKLYHTEYACLLTFSAPSQTEVDAARHWFAAQLESLPPRASLPEYPAGPPISIELM